MKLQTLLKRHRSDLTLVIGNGINRYGPAPITNSWHDLLAKLGEGVLHTTGGNIPAGIALTEFYDLLELQPGPSATEKSLQRAFCDLMKGWLPYEHHKRVVSWAKQARCPLLTTNFDKVLSEAGGCKLLHTRRDGFADYYPWETYYGHQQFDDPCDGFAIWHINGMERYPRSIRLGLSHYMGSVQRARDWLHRGNERRLFSGKDIRNWRGFGTWLHIVFNKHLVIFGLGLEEDEVFLRWLLIERARYFRKFPHRKKESWYLHTKDNAGSGKLFFLNGVGVEPVRVESYDELYGAETWADLRHWKRR